MHFRDEIQFPYNVAEKIDNRIRLTGNYLALMDCPKNEEFPEYLVHGT